MFRNELAKEIEKIERKIKELENKLDSVFSNSEPDNDGVMETVMFLSENIVLLKEKEQKLKEIFWMLVQRGNKTMKKYQVIEDNGGGLTLVVFENNGNVEYLI